MFGATAFTAALLAAAAEAGTGVDVVRYELAVELRDSDLALTAMLHCTGSPHRGYAQDG